MTRARWVLVDLLTWCAALLGRWRLYGLGGWLVHLSTLAEPELEAAGPDDQIPPPPGLGPHVVDFDPR